MTRFKHNQKTTALYNKVINDYKLIDSDKDLNSRKISYSDYNSLGLLLDGLRFEGHTETICKSIADYFKSLGCKIELKEISYLISL